MSLRMCISCWCCLFEGNIKCPCSFSLPTDHLDNVLYSSSVWMTSNHEPAVVYTGVCSSVSPLTLFFLFKPVSVLFMTGVLLCDKSSCVVRITSTCKNDNDMH